MLIKIKLKIKVIKSKKLITRNWEILYSKNYQNLKGMKKNKIKVILKFTINRKIEKIFKFCKIKMIIKYRFNQNQQVQMLQVK